MPISRKSHFSVVGLGAAKIWIRKLFVVVSYTQAALHYLHKLRVWFVQKLN